MRSRCSACVLGLGDYLQHTWHATTRPADVPTFDPALRWLGLQVRRHQLLADGVDSELSQARSCAFIDSSSSQSTSHPPDRPCSLCTVLPAAKVSVSATRSVLRRPSMKTTTLARRWPWSSST